jgi:uncharacterized damage-inducible protein DinB
MATTVNTTNTECRRIADALASAINGDAWYGDSMRKILDHVTAEQAQARPIGNTHTIWELVVHVEAWVTLCQGAMQGAPIPAWSTMPKEMDWPLVNDTSEQAWKRAGSSFFSTHLKLVETIKAFSDPRLEETVPGRPYSFYHLLQGMIQHAVYHAGQIALLKKSVQAST